MFQLYSYKGWNKISIDAPESDEVKNIEWKKQQPKAPNWYIETILDKNIVKEARGQRVLVVNNQVEGSEPLEDVMWMTVVEISRYGKSIKELMNMIPWKNLLSLIDLCRSIILICIFLSL